MLEAVTGRVLHMESLAPPLVPLVSPLTRRTAVDEVVVLVEPNVVDVTAVDDVGTDVSLMVVGRGVEEVLVSLRV